MTDTLASEDLIGGGNGALDPVTFEILRSRLSAINDEAAMTMRLVSGSPVANEAYDMNVGLMDADGDCFAIGMYITIHALALSSTVRDIRQRFDADEIGPGDVFMSNDPYVGACHQMDVAVVAPIFAGDRLVAWTGSTVHQIDLGGPVEGQVQLGATSIWSEQPLFPPIKIVDAGELRPDVERGYLRRTRLPHLVGLDLKAMIAGCNVGVARVQDLAGRYGTDVVLAAIEGINVATAARFRARLRELPDGTWSHRGYIEYDDVYPVVVEMTKQGDSLTFDYTGSADQAGAVINCTRPACVGAVVAAVLPYLCYDMAWSPAGLQRAIEVRTREGTVVHAAWPAGTSKATTTGSFMATISAGVCLSKLLAASESHLRQFMSTWMGGLYVEDMFGVDQRGEFFGAAILDAMAGGSGARAFADGLDAGGFLDSPSAIIANIEDIEYSYPVLYLSRRIQPDTGGAGKYRGGNTLAMTYIVHGVEQLPTKILHAIGTYQPGLHRRGRRLPVEHQPVRHQTGDQRARPARRRRGARRPRRPRRRTRDLHRPHRQDVPGERRRPPLRRHGRRRVPRSAGPRPRTGAGRPRRRRRQPGSRTRRLRRGHRRRRDVRGRGRHRPAARRDPRRAPPFGLTDR